jgi:hypothetical protein
MPIHDWTRVPPGVFHDFRHSWIEEIHRSFNAGTLPENYYAMTERPPEQFRAVVLPLQGSSNGGPAGGPSGKSPTKGGLLLAPPKARLAGETDMEFYRRKQNAIAVRHVSGDQIVAMVEVVSPGNKNNRHGLRSFVEKAAELLDRRIHLLILDLFPPGPRDPQGIHGAIWEDIAGQEYTPPADKPLTMVAYESALSVRAFIEPAAVGDVLADMPLFLEPGGHVLVPLEATYRAAWGAFPRRWRAVLERPPL